ncbi:SUMF1/EgtB/PvdO family nonheme iron enzyme [Chloroflexota bacterium]
MVVILWARMGTPLPEEYIKPEAFRFPTGTTWHAERYLSGTEWEYLDGFQAAKETGAPLVVVYRRTEEPAIKLSDPDWDKKRGQWQHVEAFFGTFVNPDGSIRRGSNQYATPDDFRATFEHDLRVLVTRLLKDSAKPDPVAMPTPSAEPDLWPGSPFPGLRAFTPADAPIFYGRGRETDDLVKLITNGSRFVAVVGASGSGKSSLVGAGLIPRLHDNAIPGGKDWILPDYVRNTDNSGRGKWTGSRFTPDELGTGDPFAAFATTLLDLGAFDKATLARLREDPTALDDLCQTMLQGKPDWAEVLFFIDQSEELFTSVHEEHRAAFANLLTQMAHTDRLRVIVTLRADFYARCVEWPELNALVNQNTYSLSAPGLLALGEMITRPAARAGLQFEEGLPDRILTDTGSTPGALALLGYTLDELYQMCGANGLLSHAAYELLGGVQGAIGTRAQNIFTTLNEETQAALQPVFRGLISVDTTGTATRQRTPQNLIKRDAAAAQLVDAFTDARLLTASRDEGGKPLVEVAHEALLRSWPMLADWIADTKDDHSLLRQMRLAAQLWDTNDRADAFRWPDERLQPVYQALDNLDINREQDLTDVERAFIRPEFDRLLEELNDPDTAHIRRNIIGERLDVLGDRRPGVGLRPDGLPDIAWCPVPGGKITLEDDAGTFDVQPFYIAQFPITYVQFQTFVDAPDGFEDDRWWEDLTEDYRKQEVSTQSFAGNNRPRDNVSWYQAVAFCRWLNEKLPEDRWPDLPVTPDQPESGPLQRFFRGGNQTEAKWSIRLPTEWEWQQAATGGDPSREYPWPGGWDGRIANTTESGLSRTTTVGMYPQGASPVGALDMSGNVQEWCLNEYDKAKVTSIKGDNARVVRGGSWACDESGARAASRNVWAYPYYRNGSQGFRVCCCVSSPISKLTAGQP